MEHLIIGIDHGYGRMKTDNSNFVSGMTESTVELPFSSNVLEYQGRFYSIGEQQRIGVSGQILLHWGE